ncbi:hypothetical protein Sdia_49660 [Streptomyces diastaticus subsp. diastaticus]|uniref:Uncharacterized protein n=1 Tax=Streptomyces diastaticus subsp. diastaticus TaxID=68040 RepID=A0ABQ1CV48_STRDI|nr:hypothetical protein Srut_45420 [Streptomyces rutgersensis]GFH74198.1 hypothetical protein Sdia_49660 [Streptomyces diastaticus subsp. diastaticus]GGU41794.1 hypothetical protein GCM10015534_50530 [Streptomyces diastaticus subsp. diastaticus]
MGGGLRAAAFLAGTFFLTGGLAALFFAGPPERPAPRAEDGDPLPEVREAMVVRLPVRGVRDTCAHRFTRPCRG